MNINKNVLIIGGTAAGIAALGFGLAHLVKNAETEIINPPSNSNDGSSNSNTPDNGDTYVPGTPYVGPDLNYPNPYDPDNYPDTFMGQPIIPVNDWYVIRNVQAAGWTIEYYNTKWNEWQAWMAEKRAGATSTDITDADFKKIFGNRWKQAIVAYGWIGPNGTGFLNDGSPNYNITFSDGSNYYPGKPIGLDNSISALISALFISKTPGTARQDLLWGRPPEYADQENRSPVYF
jgi:hypothetical protein